jgi:hypothetical protein
MKSRSRFTCLFLFALSCLYGQARPNFSGTWTLNRAESDYSDPRAQMPDRITLTVHHKSNSLKYRFDREKDGKKAGYSVDVEIGGSPYESNEAGVVMVEWKGEALSIHTMFNPGTDRQAEQNEVWTLAADGKKLVNQFVFQRPGRKEVRLKMAFDKAGDK